MNIFIFMVTSRYGSYHHKDKVVFENNRFSRSPIYLYFYMPENVFHKTYMFFVKCLNFKMYDKKFSLIYRYYKTIHIIV